MCEHDKPAAKNPDLSGAASQQEDLVEVWDRVADTYKRCDVSLPSQQANLHHILKWTGDPRGRTICEVGCGSATTSAVLCAMGAELTLVDRSPKSLEFAKNYFESKGLGARYELQDALNMDLGGTQFDVVWNGGVIEHFEDDGKISLLKAMWDIIQPGGLLMVLVPNWWNIPFLIGKKWAIWHGHWEFGYEDDPTHYRLGKLARKAGIKKFCLYAFNPIIGFWFLPRGRRLTEKLGLDTLEWHKKRCWFGHVLVLAARKPVANLQEPNESVLAIQ